MNMIIGKKQIILASLVVGLGLAVYINYQFAQSDGALTATSAIESDKNYGDAQLVDANDPTVEDIDGEAYFAEAKVTRQRSRDESVETLKNMMASADVDPDIKAEMALKATEIAKSIETEGKIENLIKAKGFEDCMVYYDTDVYKRQTWHGSFHRERRAFTGRSVWWMRAVKLARPPSD